MGKNDWIGIWIPRKLGDGVRIGSGHFSTVPLSDLCRSTKPFSQTNLLARFYPNWGLDLKNKLGVMPFNAQITWLALTPSWVAWWSRGWPPWTSPSPGWRSASPRWRRGQTSSTRLRDEKNLELVYKHDSYFYLFHVALVKTGLSENHKNDECHSTTVHACGSPDASILNQMRPQLLSLVAQVTSLGVNMENLTG